MTFDQVRAGSAVFLDANSLVYHFTNHPKYGVASTRLVHQVQRCQLSVADFSQRPGFNAWRPIFQACGIHWT
jgi:hypothetical protein